MLSATEAADTFQASGTVTIYADLTATEFSDVLAAIGTIGTIGIYGSFVLTEEPDSLSADGSVSTDITNFGPLFVTEQPDVFFSPLYTREAEYEITITDIYEMSVPDITYSLTVTDANTMEVT